VALAKKTALSYLRAVFRFTKRDDSTKLALPDRIVKSPPLEAAR